MRLVTASNRFKLSALSVALVAGLSACGSDDGPATPVGGTTVTPSSLSGTVAVGAPITNGKLRVIDATGAVVVSDVTVDAAGNYADVVLTGTAPYRIEACGYAGANYLCVYSVATGNGTANVTPLTTATVLLASGQSPSALMTGSAPTLTTDNVATAQTQLRTSLASVMSSAGVSGSLDFISGSLSAGSRTGYDGVLDAIGVTTGQDDHPFVQITPRLGDGNLYLTQGTTSGTVTAATSASTLNLSGLETLFKNMSDSFASSSACSHPTTGVLRSVATNAQLSFGDSTPLQGAAQVAAGLCSFFASGDDGETPMWGSHVLSPTLGHCDLSGAAPLCRVSFVLQDVQGDVQPIGQGMAVTQENGAWKFYGALNPIELQASARAQRTVRIDTDTPVVEYNRALAFEVQALAGLQCAKISQRDQSGGSNTVAYYKPHPGAVNQPRLSLWTSDGFGNGASLDPNVGSTRSADDTWLGLPDGNAGDLVVRNFYRGGRSVTVSLYSDSACSTAFPLNGRSEFDVDVEGVPPVWSAMPTMPWPEIDTATKTALRTLSLAAGATGTFQAAWSFPAGPVGLRDSTVCGNRGDCGDGGSARIASRSLRPSATGSTYSLHNTGEAIEPNGSKSFILGSRNGDGVGMESGFSSCPSLGVTEKCH